MMTRSCIHVVCLAILLLGDTPSAHAAGPIRDDADLFSLSAVQRAGQEISEIQRAFNLDVHVETFATLPRELAAQFPEAGSTKREQLLHHWAEQRARAIRTDGVYILACEDPLRVRVVFTEQILSSDDRQRVRKLLDQRFATGRFDQGLLDALQLLRTELEQRTAPSPWRWISGLLIAAIGTWIVVDIAGWFKLNGNDDPQRRLARLSLPGGLTGAMGGYALYWLLMSAPEPDSPLPEESPAAADAVEHPAATSHS